MKNSEAHQGRNGSRMVLFIVNERAGNGRGGRAWRVVEQELRARGTAYEVVAEREEADAFAKTKEFLKRGGVKAVAIIGGDGTLHGLLPLLAGSGIPLGLIPAGSGNDTARAFGIPKSPAAALDIVLTGRPRPADLLSARLSTGESRLTLTALAIGLDAAVAGDVNGSRYKRWCNRLGLGSLAYLIGLVRALSRYQPRTVEVTVDGAAKTYERVWLSAVSNVANYGGGLRISPGARPDDGLLHVCVVHGCTAWQLLRVFPTILNGSHVRTRYVSVLRGAEISVSSVRPIPAYGDGEPAGEAPLDASALSGQLLFMAAGISG